MIKQSNANKHHNKSFPLLNASFQLRNTAWALNVKHQNSQHDRVQHFFQTIHFKVSTLKECSQKLSLSGSLSQSWTGTTYKHNRTAAAKLSAIICGWNKLSPEAWRRLIPSYSPPLPTSEGCAILPKYQESTRNQMPWGQNKMLHVMDQAVAAIIHFCLDFALQQKHNLQQSPLHLSHYHLFKMWFLFF